MLIDFRTLFPKYNIKPKGICHIGGNIGEEFPVYMELGITRQVWIEANPRIYKILVENIKSNPEAIAWCFCAGDEQKEVVLHESNNAGQSSSILELGTHKEAHPEVRYVGDIKSMMYRVEDFFKPVNENIDLDLTDVDFLNIDIQGAELMALKGMGDLLNQFKAAYIEVNKAELYKGCALVEEVDEYLKKFGFERVETKWCGNTGWGDALYINRFL